jgi:hypothetical protein
VKLAVRTFIIAAMLLLPGVAFACSCGPVPTVLDAFDGSKVVIIARVSSVERVKEEYRSAKLVVEKVYKGNVRPGDELPFLQGDGVGCLRMFSEQDVGKRLLLYLGLPLRDSKHWLAFICGRSTEVKSATEDLLYIDNIDKVRGKTRVSGKYRPLFGQQGLNVANRTIKIVGQDQTYETKTDENGVFEIYDLPPGDYRLEPEIPSGWKIALDWGLRSSSASSKETSDKSVAFTLPPQKHASIDLAFERVTDAP